MGIPKGTKLTDNPKDITLKFRYDRETSEKLEFLCAITKRTKAQVIRDGIDKQYAEIKKER